MIIIILLKADIETISKKTCVLTTEKDYVRLIKYGIVKERLFYLPIELVIDRRS